MILFKKSIRIIVVKWWKKEIKDVVFVFQFDMQLYAGEIYMYHCVSKSQLLTYEFNSKQMLALVYFMKRKRHSLRCKTTVGQHMPSDCIYLNTSSTLELCRCYTSVMIQILPFLYACMRLPAGWKCHQTQQFLILHHKKLFLLKISYSCIATTLIA